MIMNRKYKLNRIFWCFTTVEYKHKIILKLVNLAYLIKQFHNLFTEIMNINCKEFLFAYIKDNLTDMNDF